MMMMMMMMSVAVLWGVGVETACSGYALGAYLL